MTQMEWREYLDTMIAPPESVLAEVLRKERVRDEEARAKQLEDYLWGSLRDAPASGEA